MLDPSIPVVDNHCHPILLDQELDVPGLRGCFTASASTEFANKHVPYFVYYHWVVRQLARFYGCSPTEVDVVNAHNSRKDTLLADLMKDANITALVLDPGYPPPDKCYTPEQIGQAGSCSTAKLLRLEVLMQELIMAHADFDEVIDRFASEVRFARDHGYVALKSIVAYRTGLAIQSWSKDEAASSFSEARAEASSRGQLRICHKQLLDYLLHVAFKHAAEQQLPIQFHTGYGDTDIDLRMGNPLHLRDVLECWEYQNMPIVLLHESYPYTREAAYMASVYENIYLDLSYTIPLVEKLEMLSFTRQAMGVAPASKLMVSTDGIYIPEMYWVGALRVRNILGQILQEMIEADELDEEQAMVFANQILHLTATQLYRLNVKS